MLEIGLRTARWRPSLLRAVFQLLSGIAFSLSAAAPPDLDALLQDGSQALAAGDYVRAEHSFRDALQRRPASVEILNNLAISIARQKREKEAIALYLRALDEKPQDPTTSRNLAMAYFRDGEYAKALPILQALADAQPSFAANDLAGQSLLALGRNREAAVYLERAVQLNPVDLPTLDLLGKAYYQSKQYSKVSDVFRRIMAISPNSAEAHVLLAMAYDKEHQDNQAENEYRTAAKADATIMGVHSGLGLLYWRKGKTAEAEAEFRAELQRYPTDTVSNRYLGEILRKDNRPAEAIPYLEAAVKGDSTDKTAWFELGKSETMVNAPRKALAPLREAVKLDPNYYQAHFVLGSALRSTGDLKGAAAEQRTAERIQAQERTRLVHNISPEESSATSK